MDVLTGDTNAGFAILADPFLKEVALPLETDECHPGGGVFRVIETGLFEGHEKAVGAQLDISLPCGRRSCQST